MSGAYYPSVIVTLRIRFDEVFAPLLGLDLTQQPTSKELRAAQNFDPISEKTRSNLPLLMSGVKDSLSRVFNLQPRSMNTVLETYRRASTFGMEFDYARVPIDPTLIRSAAVEIYLDAVKPEAFSDGMIASTAAGVASGQPRLATLVPSPENLLFVGTVDEWETTHDNDGSHVRIEGRDLRAIFLDSPVDSAIVQDIDVSQPIATRTSKNADGSLNLTRSMGVVNQILARHPMGQAFTVAVNPAEWPGGRLPSPYSKDGVTRMRIPADTAVNPTSGKVRATPKADPNQINYWDLVTQYCYLCGAIPYFHGAELRIRPVRTLYETIDKAGFDPQFPSPFATSGFDISGARDITEGDPARKLPFYIRKMVFGRNIEKIRVSRKFNGYRPRVIECVSLDTSSATRGPDKLLLAAWDGTQDPWDDGTGIGTVKKRNNQHHKPRYVKTNVSPSGFRSESEVLRVSVPGIKDVSQLREIAKSIFDEVGRGEISGTCETKDLASFATEPGQGGNSDPDLVRLRPGDPVEFLTDTSATRAESPVAHVLVQNAQASFAEAVEKIAHAIGGASPSRGDYNFARVLAATSRKLADVQSFYRVTAVRYTFDGSGLNINFDFHNYIEARFDTRKAEAKGAGIGPFGGKQGGLQPFDPTQLQVKNVRGGGLEPFDPNKLQVSNGLMGLRDQMKKAVRGGAVVRSSVPRAVPAQAAGANRTRGGGSDIADERQSLLDARDGVRSFVDEQLGKNLRPKGDG